MTMDLQNISVQRYIVKGKGRTLTPVLSFQLPLGGFYELKYWRMQKNLARTLCSSPQNLRILSGIHPRLVAIALDKALARPCCSTAKNVCLKVP